MRFRGTFPFEDLSFDIRVLIVDNYLSQSELHSLSLVNKRLYSLVVPALYRNIRLISNISPSGSGRTALQTSQAILSRTLIFRPEIALYIRKLTWQAGDFPVGELGNPFWTLFPLLENVTAVHLIDPHPTCLAHRTPFSALSCNISHIENSLSVTAVLFPRVRHIRISGMTAMSYVIPIFHSPETIETLELELISPNVTLQDLLSWINSTKLPKLRTFAISLKAPEMVTSDTLSQLISVYNNALVSIASTIQSLRLRWKPLEYRTIGRRVSRIPKAHTNGPSKFLEPITKSEIWPCLRYLELLGPWMISDPYRESLMDLQQRGIEVHVGNSGTET
ncbi:hypothetical protein M422DRAFT_773931 [Sphaerobolus stellatus SS14]|nr:hypothetical protein M422DRAFT_773931 [Sphaerobolus stellatus SS14]